MIVICGILLTLAIQAAVIYAAYRDISMVFANSQPFKSAQPKLMWPCKTYEWVDRIENGVRISKPVAEIIATEGVTMRRALKPEDLRPLMLSDLVDDVDAAMDPVSTLIERQDGKLRISDILNGYMPPERKQAAAVGYSGAKILMKMSHRERKAA